MAVATDFQKLRSGLSVTHYDFDPGATTLTDVAWVDMRDFRGILASFFRTIGTGAVVFKIIANSASDGSGTDVEVKSATYTAGEPDATGDYVFLEATAEEIRQAGEDAGEDARYVSAQVSVATGADEGVVTYVREALHQSLGLTADSIA